MKTLFLIRHAKSSWKFPELDDHERPLNRRGERDCLLMARHFQQQDVLPEVIYSSTAIRALDFAQAISNELMVTLIPDLSLYTFDQDELLAILQHIPDTANSVAVVGHNPAMHRLINRISQSELPKLPTASLVALNCDIEQWSELEAGKAVLNYISCPKMLL